MKPYPIAFDLNVNTTPGIYEIDVLTDQPLILYVTRDSGMEIISGNTAFNYPSNVPAYAIMYITNKTASTWLTISMSIANQSVGMNVTSGGTYELRDVITVTHWINSSISLLITTNVPVLPTNITIGPVLIKSLEPTYCPVPIIIKALERPDESLLISLAALPVAAALPLMPGLRIRQRMRRALLILGLVLMLLFYVVWALGFTNMAPQFYGPVILRFFGVLFIIGLIITIISSLT
ncbi:hypothetical protein [Vulcanisaeta sp. JCM 16159]|uniref:hypothetical protein n=1 Tax=Vulcanisaeta sp. JCM 16159 TaxID=1295371 RepID=UPI000AE1FF67|nr:hypothetical protein [Vulcanisaeta sp. JCM 16159]